MRWGSYDGGGVRWLRAGAEEDEGGAVSHGALAEVVKDGSEWGPGGERHPARKKDESSGQ